MSGIKAPILSLLTKLRSIPVINGDGGTVEPYVRIWNNQVAYELDGTGNVYPKPAFFVEVLNSPVYQDIGQNFRSADLSFKIHIAHDYLDAGDGTFEQDLPVFDLRDSIIANITGFRPTGCGALTSVSETQDFEHRNVYHFIVDFICNFTDSIGSKYDANHPQAYIESEPPTDLELDASLAIGSGQQGQSNKFLINK